MAKKNDIDDDGRVIAPMNVEGMPWHQKHPPEGEARPQRELLNRRQTARVVWNATLAGLLVALIFAGALIALVLLLLWIWR